jgi:hypothetical protein
MFYTVNEVLAIFYDVLYDSILRTLLKCLNSPKISYLLFSNAFLRHTHITLASLFSTGQHQHLSSISSYRQDSSLTMVQGCQCPPVILAGDSLLVCFILTMNSTIHYLRKVHKFIILCY